MDESQVISWNVGAGEPRERSNDWYWGLGVLAVASAVAAVFFGNGLLAVILLLGAGSIGFLAARGPREHAVKIDPRGISIDGTRYPFTSVHSFWVEHEADPPHLFLAMTGILAPHFSFPLEDEAHGQKVRALLVRFVEEEEQGPHVGDHLAEIFGL
jgi:hypothetical protein